MPTDIANVVFVRLTNVENVNVVTAIEPLLEFFNLNFVCSHFGWGLLTANSAELLVIDQLSDCRIFAARRAIRIFAQLEFAKLHAQGVYEQQAPDQRIPGTKNQLYSLSGLNHADQPGQNSQYSAFRARGHCARGWRLRIEAAVAWTLFSCEHARLTFETEDGAINIWLAGQHTGIVYQITRREVVRAVRDNVKILENLQRILAGKTGLEFADRQEWIDRFQLLFRRIKLLSAHVSGGVNNLPLQVGVIHNVKIDHPQSADTRGC